MTNELTTRYHLPDSRTKIATLFDSLSAWECINGILLAPQDLYNAGQVAHHTGIEFDRYGCIQFTGLDYKSFESEREAILSTVPRRQNRASRRPNLLSIIDGQRLCAFIIFNELARHYDEENSTRRFLSRQLRKGYKGYLTMYANWPHCMSDIVATARIDDYDDAFTLEFDDSDQIRSMYITPIEPILAELGMQKTD